MLAKSKELTEYQLATANLKRRLREKGITYGALAKSVGLSESGVKKIFIAKDGSFQRLAQLAQHAGVAMAALLADHQTVEVGFTDSQQQEFQKTPKLFLLFWLLVYERQPLPRAQAALRLAKAESLRLLRMLDELSLVKLLPQDRVQVPAVQAVRWRGEGAFVQALYRDWAKNLLESVEKPRAREGEYFLLRYLQMTPQTHQDFTAALHNLEEEFVRRSIQEMRAQPEKTHHVRWLVAADTKSFVTGSSI